MEFFLKALNFLNGYADSWMLLVAVFTFWYVRKEYLLRNRPYITIEIATEIHEDIWHFWGILVNKGPYPWVALPVKIELRIWDEVYATPCSTEIILSPEERIKLFEIGHINANGLRKIRAWEYQSNRMEISIRCESKLIGDKKFVYSTDCKFEVDVSKTSPVIKIISEHIT